MFDVIGVGHACFDKLCTVPKYPREDTANRIISIVEQGGGAVSQALVALSRLGASTAYMGSLGDDKAGQFLLNDYKKEKVNTDYINISKNAVSSESFILISQETGERTIFYYPGKIPSLVVDKEIESVIGQTKYLHLDATDYVSAVKAAKAARRNNVKVSLDGCEVERNVEKTIALISLVDILITNETYPLQVTGQRNLSDAIRQLAEFGPKLIVTTCGANGSYYFDGKEIIQYPAYDITPVDSTGAGDAFHGAFLFGLANHYSIGKCIQFASAVSAINCMTVGGRKGLPTLKQVEDYMESHSYSQAKKLTDGE